MLQEQTQKDPDAIIPQVVLAIDGVDRYKNSLFNVSSFDHNNIWIKLVCKGTDFFSLQSLAPCPNCLMSSVPNCKIVLYNNVLHERMVSNRWTSY